MNRRIARAARRRRGSADLASKGGGRWRRRRALERPVTSRGRAGGRLVVGAILGALTVAAMLWFLTPSGADLEARTAAFTALHESTPLRPADIPPLLANASQSLRRDREERRQDLHEHHRHRDADDGADEQAQQSHTSGLAQDEDLQLSHAHAQGAHGHVLLTTLEQHAEDEDADPKRAHKDGVDALQATQAVEIEGGQARARRQSGPPGFRRRWR